MKKLFYCILILMLVCIMSACNQDKSNHILETKPKAETILKKENNGLITFDQENVNQLQKGILSYGQSAKGGYYLTTVNSAHLEVNTPNSVVVNITIKNVRNELINLSELNFNLKDEKGKKSFEGKVTDNNPSTMNVKPSESVTLNIYFNVPSIQDKYMFYIDSSLDPIKVHWKIDNLKASVR